MNKLSLKMDALAVESFAVPHDAMETAGTVHARAAGPTIPSCPSFNLCPTEQCPTGACPTSATTLCRC